MRLASFAVDETDAEGAAEFEGHLHHEGGVRCGRGRGRRDRRPDRSPGSGCLGTCSSCSEAARAPSSGHPTLRRRALGSALEEVRLLAPVPRPAKVLAIGMNYADHIAELGREAPEYQYWFNKQRTCVVGPGAPVVVPRVSYMVDYEGELAMVVGRRCRYVPVDRALDVIAGYTVMNDVSVQGLAVAYPHVHDGKVLRHPRPDGTLDRDT